MSLLSDRTDLGHEFLEGVDPAEIVYAGNTWIGLSSQISRNRGDRKSGGQFAVRGGAVSIRRAVVGDVEIKSGKPITVDGENFWTGEIRSDSAVFEVDLLPNNSPQL